MQCESSVYSWDRKCYGMFALTDDIDDRAEDQDGNSTEDVGYLCIHWLGCCCNNRADSADSCQSTVLTESSSRITLIRIAYCSVKTVPHTSRLPSAILPIVQSLGESLSELTHRHRKSADNYDTQILFMCCMQIVVDSPGKYLRTGPIGAMR